MRQNRIKKITTKIVKHYNPAKIILFGSRAWGKPRCDSDVDLLILKDTIKNPWSSLQEIRNCLTDFDESFDLVVYTPKQIEERLKLGDIFVKNIIKKGKVLYERQKIRTC